MGTKRAVIIGCNYPGSQCELHGCANDAKAMYSLLTSKFAFAPNDVQVLVDSDPGFMQPTGINIKRALTAMVRSARPGDNLVLHYSGHGTLIPQSQEGVKESAIVPTDMNLICDDDLHAIVEPLASGAKFTFIADCCHSGGMLDQEEDYVVGGHTPDASRPSPQEMESAPGGLVGMIVSNVLNKYSSGGGAPQQQHHSGGGGILGGLMEKIVQKVGGLDTNDGRRELPPGSESRGLEFGERGLSTDDARRELPPESDDGVQSRGLDFGEGHHKKHHHGGEENYGYEEGRRQERYGEGYQESSRYGEERLEGRYEGEGFGDRRRPEEFEGEFGGGRGEGRRHNHREEGEYEGGNPRPYGEYPAQGYPPQQGSGGQYGGGGYEERPAYGEYGRPRPQGYEAPGYGGGGYGGGPPAPAYGGPPAYGQGPVGYGPSPTGYGAPSAYGPSAPGYGGEYGSGGGFGQGLPPVDDGFHEGYMGRIHEYPYGTHKVVRDRSLPADVLAQILSQRLGHRVSVENIRTSLNALFAGDASTMVHSAVQIMQQMGGGGGGGGGMPAPGGMFGGMMGGGTPQGPSGAFSVPMKPGVGILITGCTRDETSADADPSGDPRQAFGALSNAISTVVSQSSQPLTNRQLVLAVREYLAKGGFEQHPCLECTSRLGEMPFITY